VQVGVRIGLDDIERLQKKTNKLSSGKKHAPVICWWVGFGFWVVSLRNRRFIGGSISGRVHWKNGLHSPEVAPRKASRNTPPG